jgi:regulator of sigma E protease
MFTFVVFILVLSLLVFVHELGHFWTAKKCGLKPEEFGFGFPPRAIGAYKNKENKWSVVKGKNEPDDAIDTIYSLNWIPIGGFVKLGEDDDPGDNPNHFNSKPIYQRFLILVAGVTMNILLAVVLFSFGFMVGLPQRISPDMAAGAKISNQHVQVMEVIKDSPAESAEFAMGDIIIDVNGISVTTVEELQKFSNDNINKEIIYTVRREGREMEKTVIPELRSETKMGGIGVSIVETAIVKYPVHIAIWQGVTSTVYLTGRIMQGFYDLFRGLFTGQGMTEEIGGPIRIAEITGQVARMGFSYLINFTAILSINLAIINILPIPALDGGRILFLLFEKIKGRPMKKELEGTMHYIGFMLLMLLIVVVTYKDIVRWWTT